MPHGATEQTLMKIWFDCLNLMSFLLSVEIRLERYFKAIKDFDWVLEQEPDNVKALLRRADAHEKIGQMKEAHADLQRSVIVDENNKRAKVSVCFC